MSGSSLYTMLLLGMGLRRFSVIPRNIPIIKEIISHLSYIEAAETISHIDAIESSDDMALWLKNVNKRLLADVLPRLPVSVGV